VEPLPGEVGRVRVSKTTRAKGRRP
jgi:hypothetical protein